MEFWQWLNFMKQHFLKKILTMKMDENGEVGS